MIKTSSNNNLFLKTTLKLQVKLAMLQVLEQEIPWQVDRDGNAVRDNDTGHRVLAFYPKNDSDFAKWSLLPGKSQYIEPLRQELVVKLDKLLQAKGIKGDPEFGSHSRSTFANPQRADMKAQAKASFNALCDLAGAQYGEENLNNRVIQLESKLKSAEAKVVSASSAAMQDIRAAAEVRKKAIEWKRAHEQLSEQLNRMIDAHAKVLAAKDKEISDLRKQLTEIQGFTLKD